MSTNCNNPYNFLLKKKEEKEGINEFENSSQPTSENPSSSQEIPSEFQENLGNTDREKEEDNARTKDREENLEATVSSRELQKAISVEEEEEEGFTTPTSLDHKIPAITQCPPAPKKTRHSKRKRQASPASRRSLQFDASTEVESVFLPMNRDNVEEQKIKKPRTDDEDEI